MFPHNDEGRAELLSTYDTETFQEIASHGCESGVCSEHIYYGDTIAFFDKYEGEILDLIHERYGVDELVSIFKRSDADYDMYRNECCWLFIENVAEDVIQSLEYEQQSEDETIGNYMADYTLADSIAEDALALSKDTAKLLDKVTNGINPPATMTLNRYSQT